MRKENKMKLGKIERKRKPPITKDMMIGVLLLAFSLGIVLGYVLALLLGGF